MMYSCFKNNMYEYFVIYHQLEIHMIWIHSGTNECNVTQYKNPDMDGME